MATRKSPASKTPVKKAAKKAVKVAKTAKTAQAPTPPSSKVITRTKASPPSALSVITNESARLKQRIDAVTALGWNVCADKTTFRTVLGLVKDPSTPGELRHAALSTIQASTFSAKAFAPYRADFLAAMRAVRTDPDYEMRQRSFGILARENDADTQAMLIEGLEDPNKAMLPPEKALQLLSYDVHSGAYDVARQMVDKPPNEQTRMEALRVLAADASSTNMFEKILRDKGEDTRVRQLAASALHQLAPKRLQSCARDLTMDEGEAPGIRSMSLTALDNFGNADDLAQDNELNDYVSGVKESEGTDHSLRQAASRYSSRRGR